jgi:hypothetical protein
MVAPASPVQLVRLSPSGPELGQPPAQIGGGALIKGRTWVAQGTGANLVNTPNPAANVSGLSAVPVDMRAGYKYDVEVDAQFFGTTGGVEIVLFGSSDGGNTYGGIASTLPLDATGSCRLHVPNMIGPYDHLRVQVVTSFVSSADCQYLPQLTALKVTEYSTS